MEQCMYTALLDAFVDGELSPEETARVQAHLDSCPACRAYVDDALAIRAALGGWEDTPVPEDFTRRVMDAVAAHPRRRPTPWKKALVPLAACLAVVILALPLRGYLLNRQPDPASAVQTETTEEAPQETWSSEEDTAGTPVEDLSPASPENDTSAADAGADEAESIPETAQSTPKQFSAQAPETPAAADDSASLREAPPVQNDVTTAQGSANAPESYLAAQATPTHEDSTGEAVPAQSDAGLPFATLTLTADQAGELLDGCDIVEQTQTQTTYRLDTAAYVQLKCALIAAGNLPDTEALSKTQSDDATPYALVIVTNEP